MQGFETIQGSGARTSPAAASIQQQGSSAWGSAADSWSTTTTEASMSEPAVPETGGPRLIIESEAGHRIVLTYQDLILAITLGGLGLAGYSAWRSN